MLGEPLRIRRSLFNTRSPLCGFISIGFFLLIIIFRGYFLHLIDVAVFGGGFLHFVFVREDQDHLCLHFIGSATRALGNNNKNGEA